MDSDPTALDLRVILVEPSLPENVGAVARVMDNLGVRELRLVEPCDYLTASARSVATHSSDLLREARVFGTLSEAVKDCHLVIGTTARQRDPSLLVTPLPAARSLIPNHGTKTAVVFGRESSGLTNEELAICNGWTTIPTFAAGRSFNLSHAVAIVLYELRRHRAGASQSSASSEPPATSQSVEKLKRHLFEVLERTRFIRSSNRNALWLAFSSFIGRARPTERDTKLLHGFFHRVLITIDRGTARPSSSAKTRDRSAQSDPEQPE